MGAMSWPAPQGVLSSGYLAYLCSGLECRKTLSVKEAFLNFITLNDFFNLNFKYLANRINFEISNLLSPENSKIPWQYKGQLPSRSS